jgi:hypothetical protein
MAAQDSGGAAWEQRVARVFGLTGDRWMRHANPLSVWTRFTILPLIALAVWSRTWLGWWSLVPVAMVIVWNFVNPLLFPPPASTRNWASKAVLGERIWTDRDRIDLPAPHRSRVPDVASGYAAVGLVLLVYGLVVFDVIAVVAGILIVAGGKLWFIDRMVLLFEDVKTRRPEYAAWEY